MQLIDAKLEHCCGIPSQFPKSTVPEIIFSGRSNVGKSSLINKLLCQKSLARTSNKPGKTATINFYKAGDIYFVDLPGYGYAKVSFAEKQRWANLVESYLADNRNFAIFIQLIDIRHQPTDDDMQMLSYLKERSFPFIVALTKSDKLKKGAYQQRLSELQTELQNFGSVPCIPFSSITGQGVAEIKKIIKSCLGKE